jgi:hypothetical protein
MPAVVLKSLSCSQHSELLTLLQHHLSPLLLKMLSERSAFPLALRGTRIVFLLLKQFSPEVETEAEIILTLLIKLISGETGAGEPLAWVDEGARDGDHARVRLSSIPHLWHTGLLTTTRFSIRTCRLCSDGGFMRSVWQRYDALATDGDTGSASSAASSPSSYPRSSAWSPHVPPCSASLRRCTVWVYLRATLNRTFIATTAWTAS